MLELRVGLFMSDLKSELFVKVESNEVVVVGGEIGCGKII